MSSMANSEIFLSGLMDIPEEGLELAANEDPTPYYKNWGFTIYRTCYKPSSDEKWDKLMETIWTTTREQLVELAGGTENDESFRTLWSHFRLDARSDIAMDGLDMDAVRWIYKNGEGGAPLNSDWVFQPAVFLLADENVLNDVEEPKTVKCVDVDYVAVDWIPKSRRVGPQTYFGWTRITRRSIAPLWQELKTQDLQRIASYMTCFGNKDWELLWWP